MKHPKIMAMFVACVIAVSAFTPIASANPSTYWCTKHQKTGCTHCANHSVANVSTGTASCTQPGGQIRYCSTSGCGATFYQTPPLGHLYTPSQNGATKSCVRTVSCGALNGATSSMFQHYMYRTGNMANYISNAWQSPGHEAIDITNTGYISINGFPIYAQGSGTVTDKGGGTGDSRGFFVEVTYNINGSSNKVRYLHLQSGSNASGTVSTSTLLGLTGDTGTTVAAGDYHL
ncbi:MAG: M23 family metallopeptidase, partial [Oscillospiraceae bacterium]|nr:M23 family metallopeptidase [Oscillospiraceae bacterium]